LLSKEFSVPFITPQQLKRIRNKQKIQAQEILMFEKVMKGLRSGLKLNDLLKVINESVRKGLGFKRAGIFLVDPDGKNIRLDLGVNENGKYERDYSFYPITSKKGANPLSDIVNGYTPFFFTNNLTKSNPNRLWEKEMPVINNAGVPIQVGKGQIIGVLCVDNLYAKRPITRAEITVLLNYATQVGLALQSIMTFEELLNQSTTDTLTGIHNRRFFDSAFENELKRCQRYKRTFSLVIADIYHFKKINDTFGHKAGDEVIKQVSVTIQDSLRRMDIVTRIGGEEFGIILPETIPNRISTVTNRILKNIRQARPTVNEMTLQGHQTTISLGVATFKKGDKVTTADIFQLADKSLYTAKTGGRNRCGPVQRIIS
jgi:diguanylate cyclase (GGDEF)-like protein